MYIYSWQKREILIDQDYGKKYGYHNPQKFKQTLLNLSLNSVHICQVKFA